MANAQLSFASGKERFIRKGPYYDGEKIYVVARVQRHTSPTQTDDAFTYSFCPNAVLKVKRYDSNSRSLCFDFPYNIGEMVDIVVKKEGEEWIKKSAYFENVADKNFATLHIVLNNTSGHLDKRYKNKVPIVWLQFIDKESGYPVPIQVLTRKETPTWVAPQPPKRPKRVKTVRWLK